VNIVAFIQQVLDSSTDNSGSNTRSFCRQEDCRDHECGFFARILFSGTIQFVPFEYLRVCVEERWRNIFYLDHQVVGAAAMEWIKKHVGTNRGEEYKDDHAGAGSGDRQQDPNSYSQLEETSPRDHGTSGRGSADMATAQSAGNSQNKWNKLNPFSKFSRANRSKDDLDVRRQGGGAPGDHQEGESDRKEEQDGQDEDEAQQGPVEAQEECLLTIPGAIAHMVDDQESPLLATGNFSIVRIIQKGSGIVILAHVGDGLHWPVTKDTPTVKLDPTHYFFSLPIPASVDEAADDDDNGHNNEVPIASLSPSLPPGL
jgi:hypothetical protein